MWPLKGAYHVCSKCTTYRILRDIDPCYIKGCRGFWWVRFRHLPKYVRLKINKFIFDDMKKKRLADKTHKIVIYESWSSSCNTNKMKYVVAGSCKCFSKRCTILNIYSRKYAQLQILWKDDTRNTMLLNYFMMWYQIYRPQYRLV